MSVAARGEAGGRPGSSARLAAVFLDGEYEDPAYYAAWARAADLIVAADGGGRFLTALGVVPDVLVGDFDSLDEEAVAAIGRAGARIERHPVRKDQTDGELAVGEARLAGATELVLAGALGALDHVLGHLALLRRVEVAGTPARIVAPALTVRVLGPGSHVTLDAPAGTRVSLAPLGGDTTVTLAGFEYDLDRGRLPFDACLGLGNAVAGATTGPGPGGGATIRVHEGDVALLVASGREAFGTLRRPAAAPPAE